MDYMQKKRANYAKDEKEEERNVFSRSRQKWDIKSQIMFTLWLLWWFFKKGNQWLISRINILQSGGKDNLEGKNCFHFSNTMQNYLLDLGSILITLCKICHCAKLSKVHYNSKNLCSSILILVRGQFYI